MNYEKRLRAAATIVLDSEAQGPDVAVDPEEIGVAATLKPHQFEGVSWLIRRYLLGVNVILGDEMGLGKTLQAISFISYLKVHQMSPGPFLVLCPLSVTDGWVSEMCKFTPKLKVLQYVGDKKHRCNLRKSMYDRLKVPWNCFDVLLTTYDIALVDQDFLSQIPWQYAIIDEAQRLKNPSSVLYNVLKEHFLIPRRLLMTGTPIQNNLTELWALLQFCMPQVFGTLEQFLSTFEKAGNLSSSFPLSGISLHKTEVNDQYKTLRYALKAFMLRRTKSKLIECGNLILPPLTEVTVMAPLVSLQKKVYVSILRKELPKLLVLSSAPSNQQSLQNIVIQLRKACSHPYLFPGIEPEPFEEGEHLVQVIFYEQDWNPQVDKQALQRAHRIGQRNHVLSINLVTRLSVEEVIMRRAERKLQLSHNVVGKELVEQKGKEAGVETGNLRSIILGLHLFDHADMNSDNCIDDSGKWGHGGMFNVLAKLSSTVPDMYQRASEFQDLHLGDLHLIRINEKNCGLGAEAGSPQWVALAVVQSYNPRCKIPRSSISIPDLERCLSKVSFAASQNSASIHMPRIGYQDGSGRSQWYTVERLLRKYASVDGIKIYVYYHPRSS